jgi:hypothetical protein
MLAFWLDIISPLLTLLRPDTIVEIGSESGKTTRLLLGLGRSFGATTHCIDPVPGFDVAAWQAEHGDKFVFHGQKSLDALPSIDRFGVVLIDGDHNWYTVHEELRLIEKRCREIGQGMPLILLHDTGWPYARRDLYYDPDSIPQAYRHPWRRAGIHPTSSDLLPKGGFNANLCNAAHEGGPRNGVLTAIEDYLHATSEKIDLVQIPAAFGLGILMPSALREKSPDAAAFIALWAHPNVRSFIERLEVVRIGMLMREMPPP